MDIPLGASVALSDPAPLPRGQTFEGRFFTLRPIDPAADAGPLYAAGHGSPEKVASWAYLPEGPFPSLEGMRAFLETMAKDPNLVAYTVVDRKTGGPAGICSYLNIVPSSRRLEIGWLWYPPAYQRTKANTEATYLLLHEAFETLRYRRVEWKCNALNERSRNAAVRLGFQHEGTFRQHMIVKGRNRDTAFYAMLDSDWPNARGNLERWLYHTATDENGRPTASLSAR